MIPTRGQVRFLASVTSVTEARLAAANGADIIDCKDPASGALGALPLAVVRAIAAAATAPVSATVGDLTPDPDTISAAVSAMAATGVDYFKVGFFPGGDAAATIEALGCLPLGPVRLVGLLLADKNPDFLLIEHMASAGFAGVMLDTAGKAAGALPDVLAGQDLQGFVDRAHSSGLLAGLAGALRLRHIPALAALQPDILGFRGALCRDLARSGEIDASAVCAVRDELSKFRVHGPLTKADAAE